LRSRFFFRLSA